MTDRRLNGIIRASEAGKLTFTAFSMIDKLHAQEMSDVPYDGIVCEKERNPNDVSAPGDALQYMLSRTTIAPSRSYDVVGQGRELAGY